MKLVTTLFIFLGFFSWSSPNSKEKQKPLEVIMENYFQDFDGFVKSVDQLVETTSKATPSDIGIVRFQIKSTRYAYKKIEFLFDYRNTNFNKFHINGGPVYKMNEESSGDIVIPPNGLQALDELIFSDDASDELEEINRLAEELKSAVTTIAKSHKLIITTDQQIIESLRTSLVRVFTLGVTGFDTPGSANAIPEALASFQTIEQTFLPYGENLKPSAKKKYKQIKKQLKKCKKYLTANRDFDTFDRLEFLKTYINPLYSDLLSFQYLNQIKVETHKSSAHDYNTSNLFDESFLNTDHYSEFSFASLNDERSIHLGKLLFFDPILSKNVDMSCATCHDPKKGFADGLPKSKANIAGKFTQRNSPTLIDAGYAARYFWDLREHNLERQVAHVVDASLEFNTDFKAIAKRLYQSEEYVELFDEIYGDFTKKSIYTRSISNAIAAYVNSLKSFNSEFDQYVRNEIPTYPTEAKEGFNLFMGKAACGTCHFAPVFNGSVPPFYIEAESEVLGITLGLDTINPKMDNDPGRIANGFQKENQPHFNNSFKTVSVRNAELTAPYMHNGLFKTLEDVLDFYNHGGGAGMGLPIENQTLADSKLNLTQKEKTDIIVFMKTLTDTTGLTDSNIQLPTFKNHPEWNNRGNY